MPVMEWVRMIKDVSVTDELSLTATRSVLEWIVKPQSESSSRGKKKPWKKAEAAK
jgi:hypothetical protein